MDDLRAQARKWRKDAPWKLTIRVYTVAMKLTGLFSLLLGYLAVSSADATEVYRWVDDDGVIHFSQSAPPANVPGVTEMTLEDTAPTEYDPDEDLYGIDAQAERMAQLRQEMADKREQAQERQRNAARQPVTQYQQPMQYGYPYYGLPPYSPGLRPPRPEPPPRPGPYPTDTLRPVDR